MAATDSISSDAEGPLPGSGLHRSLLRWYRRSARDLPWRRTRDPYAIWVSEVMLQQTQVDTVIGYYLRFLKSFPTVHALAQANESDVLRLWEGLGYYRRARQLHAAAQQVVHVHAGQMPRDPDRLRALPGIGRYTAGAILSIAFGDRQPILEANSLRVLARWLAERDDMTRPRVQTRLWQAAENLLPKRDVGIWNQGLMELGSLICTPRNPQCDSCPVRPWCAAARQGMQLEIPTGRKRLNRESREEVAFIVEKNGRILLGPCAAGGRWGGLWDFPRLTVAAPPAEMPRGELGRCVASQLGMQTTIGPCLTVIKHGVTRFRITLSCYRARWISGRRPPKSDWRWVWPSQLDAYPLNVTGRKIARLLASTINAS